MQPTFGEANVTIKRAHNQIKVGVFCLPPLYLRIKVKKGGVLHFFNVEVWWEWLLCRYFAKDLPIM